MAKIFEVKEGDFKFIVNTKKFVKSELFRYNLQIKLKGKTILKKPIGQAFNERHFKVFMGENNAVVQYPVDHGYTALEYPDHMNERFYYVNVQELDKTTGESKSYKTFKKNYRFL